MNCSANYKEAARVKRAAEARRIETFDRAVEALVRLDAAAGVDLSSAGRVPQLIRRVRQFGLVAQRIGGYSSKVPSQGR